MRCFWFCSTAKYSPTGSILISMVWVVWVMVFCSSILPSMLSSCRVVLGFGSAVMVSVVEAGLGVREKGISVCCGLMSDQMPPPVVVL